MIIDVSIIIAAWNSEDFIKKSISSIQEKNLSIEIIVIDDASTDNTCKVVKEFPEIILISMDKNEGPASARNKGFSIAKGKWIAILDSDDWFLPNRLEKMLKNIDPSIDIVIDNMLEYRDELEPKKFYSNNELIPGKLNLENFIKSNIIDGKNKTTGYVKPIFKRNFLKNNKIQYLENILIGEDYYFLAECLASGANVKVLEVCLYCYKVRNESISKKFNSSKIDQLICTDDWLSKKYQLNDNEIKALSIRTKNLHKVKQYKQIVESIKHQKYLNSIFLMLSNPMAASLLHIPLLNRIKKGFSFV